MSAHRLFTRLRQLVVLALCTLPVPHAHAQAMPENQLKAAFLVNFLKYVEFPPSTSSTTTICLFGGDTLGPYLASFEGRSVAGKPLRIKRVTSPDQVDDCQLLFVPYTEEARFAIALRWVENMPVLTVSDADVFVRQGGCIALANAEGRMQFDVNANALSRVGLRPGSQMMRLARQVIGARK